MDSENAKAALPTRCSPRLSAKNPGKSIPSKGRPANDCSSTLRPPKRAKFTAEKSSETCNKNKKHLKKTNKDEQVVTKRIEGYRCSPHMIPPITARLSELQKNWVIKIGFGSLLTMKDCRLPKCLTMWLINQVNCDTQCLEVGGKSVAIKPLVYSLLGIPRGKIVVPPPHSGRKNNKCSQGDSVAQQFKASAAGRGLPANIAIEELVNMHDEETFCRSFMLVVLCLYLAPTSGHVINRNYLPTLSNVSLVPDMNWCDYCADYLIQGIRDYKEAKVQNVNVHGCVHIVDLMYIDLVKSPLLIVPEGTPRINFITSDLLLQLDSLDIRSTSRKGITYGRLQVTSDLPSTSNADNNSTLEVSDSDSDSELEADVDKEKQEPHYSYSSQQGNTLSQLLQRIEHKYNSKRDIIVASYNERMKKKMENLDAKKLEEISVLINQFQSSREKSCRHNDFQPRSPNIESEEIPSFQPESTNHDHRTSPDNETEAPSPNSMDAVVEIGSAAAADTLVIRSTEKPSPNLMDAVVEIGSAAAADALVISLTEQPGHLDCEDQTISTAHTDVSSPNKIIVATNNQSLEEEDTSLELTLFVPEQDITEPKENSEIGDADHSDPDHSDSEICTPQAIVPPDCQSEDNVSNEVHRLIESFSPTIRLDETEVIQICESASTPRQGHMKNVSPLQEPIQNGLCFIDPGSVNSAIKIRPKRYGKKAENAHGYAELVKPAGKHERLAAVTYNNHVQMSKCKSTRRKKDSDQVLENKTKIRICGAFVTEEEFVQSLKPRGEVDLNFMWICCVAIMHDWGSRTKVILDQGMIRELMRPYKECDRQQVIRRLKKFQLDEIEQMYLPVCSNNHWILIVVNIVAASIEIYDSLRSVKKGEHPYKDLWDNVGSNLQQTYNAARNEFVGIHDSFDIHYPKTHTQTNSHDCGFSVIRLLQCHNGKDLIGYGKMKMSTYRMELAHTLVYHRLNDLNPDRPTGTSVPTERLNDLNPDRPTGTCVPTEKLVE